MCCEKMLFENEKKYSGFEIIAGVDEAGRGPLAGPVVVAAVILNKNILLPGLNDSKKLSEKKREYLYNLIVKSAFDWKIEIISPQIIDEINILQATLLGMEKAVLSLRRTPDICLIDGNKIPEKIKKISEAIIGGDGKFASIAAASILAKVSRDRIMMQLHGKYPQYNFARNKGYPTKEHLEAIERFGITPIHRKSFKPVKQIIGSRR